MFKILPVLVVTAFTTRVTEACVMANGQEGACVPYYLCDQTSSTDEIGGIQTNDVCPTFIDICCPISTENSRQQPKKREVPQREGCGWANPDGVDLRNADKNTEGYTKFGEFPWVVAILVAEPDNKNEPEGKKKYMYSGGGSLIHPSVVLTAAHLITDAETLKIRAGEWNSQSTKEIYPTQDREVASIRVHEDFQNGTLFYDVAVLFLVKPMDLAPNVGVVCLPPARIHQEEGTRCIATGWGKDKFIKGQYSEILKKVELPVVKHDKCQASLRTTRLGKYFELHSSFMCAGGELGKDTCKGDGGSPISCPIKYDKDRYIQSGIVSWGIGCGNDGTPAVYTDVSVVRDWIDDKVVGKGYDPETYTY